MWEACTRWLPMAKTVSLSSRRIPPRLLRLRSDFSPTAPLPSVLVNVGGSVPSISFRSAGTCAHCARLSRRSRALQRQLFLPLERAAATKASGLSRLRSHKPDADRRASTLRSPASPDRLLQMGAVDAYDFLLERRGILPANRRSQPSLRKTRVRLSAP